MSPPSSAKPLNMPRKTSSKSADIKTSPPIKGPGGDVVFKCEEFKLFSNGWLESSPSVDLALKRSRFATSSRPGADERLKLKIALWNLMEHAAGQYTGDCDDLLDELTETLGNILLDTLNESNDAEKRARSAIKRTSTAVADVEAAITQMVRYRSYLPQPGDNTKGAWTFTLQAIAKEIVRYSLTRPTKSEIQTRMESDGWKFKGHDPGENWRRVFHDAGLGELPS